MYQYLFLEMLLLLPGFRLAGQVPLLEDDGDRSTQAGLAKRRAEQTPQTLRAHMHNQRDKDKQLQMRVCVYICIYTWTIGARRKRAKEKGQDKERADKRVDVWQLAGTPALYAEMCPCSFV